MTVTVDALTRYPVKGLSGQSLASVSLEADRGFPGDRRFGFARPASGFDPNNPKPLPKSKFYMLARDEALALLSTDYDDATGLLTLSAPASTESQVSGQSNQYDIATTAGRQGAVTFLHAYLGLSEAEVPQLFEASPHRFTDVSVVSKEMMHAVSFINTDSVKAFSAAIGQNIDPNRFRGNIHISGLPAFTELDKVGHQIAIGTARFYIVQRTERCPATEVDLSTGTRDLKIPSLLYQQYGHRDMGIYAEVVRGGVINAGDTVEFL